MDSNRNQSFEADQTQYRPTERTYRAQIESKDLVEIYKLASIEKENLEIECNCSSATSFYRLRQFKLNINGKVYRLQI